jgi:hypothetical protein
MAVENFSEEFERPVLHAVSPIEVDAILAGPEVQIQSTSAASPFGVEAVVLTTRLVRESDFDGADQPIYRGVRVKASDLPVSHSHLS